MTNPCVSVVIPTYRRAHIIRTCIESVLDQTERDFEIIVVDDHSGDDTETVVRGMSDPRISYTAHETNRGGNAARMTGAARARGRWIAFLDSDDAWLPTKLERQLEGLSANPDAGLSYTWFDSYSPSGEFVGEGLRFRTEGLRCPELLVQNIVGTYSTVLVDRQILEQVGGPDPTLRSCQDWDFFIRINRLTSITVVPEVLVRYLRDPADPVRISTGRSSVVQGHREIMSRTASYVDELAVMQQTERVLHLMEMFANAGATADVLAAARQLPLSALSNAGAYSRGVRLLARSEKRRHQGRSRISQ